MRSCRLSLPKNVSRNRPEQQSQADRGAVLWSSITGLLSL